MPQRQPDAAHRLGQLPVKAEPGDVRSVPGNTQWMKRASRRCGHCLRFYDQAHLTNVFKKHVGVTRDVTENTWAPRRFDALYPLHSIYILASVGAERGHQGAGSSPDERESPARIDRCRFNPRSRCQARPRRGGRDIFGLDLESLSTSGALALGLPAEPQSQLSRSEAAWPLRAFLVPASRTLVCRRRRHQADVDLQKSASRR